MCIRDRLSGADIGFHTAVGSAGTQMARNTIRACVHGDQTLSLIHIFRMVRLTDEEITGTETSAGIIETYFSL